MVVAGGLQTPSVTAGTVLGVPSTVTNSSCSDHVFAFACLIFLDSLCHSSPALFPPPLSSLPPFFLFSFLLFLFVLFLLPGASSRPRGRSCGILRPVGSLPRSLWELTWQPAGSGGPSRYMQPRAEGRGGRGREQSPTCASCLPALPGEQQWGHPCPGPGLGCSMCCPVPEAGAASLGSRVLPVGL